MTTRALIVGGTSGVGLGIAKHLASTIPSVSITISGRTPPSPLPANTTFQPIEATSMREIKRFTDQIKSDHQAANTKLDYLVMTQGTMTLAGRSEVDGIDKKMALHYYSKMLLMRELLPVMEEDGKVVIVFDSVMGKPEQVKWDDLDLKRNYGLGTASNHCQVMNDAMVTWFANQQAAISTAKRQFVHAWPGAVNTGLLRDLPWVIRGPAKVLAPLALTSPDKCGRYLMNGVSRVSEGRNQEGHQFWSYISHKGQDVDGKHVFTKEELQKVAAHTWKLIDSALEE